MNLSILLTSYNRPFFLRRTIERVLAQTSPDWRLFILDDGSDQATRDTIDGFRELQQVTIRHFQPSDVERNGMTRYSHLINEFLPKLQSGIVGYLCDNVEYEPALVETVLAWFAANPDKFSGYVPHLRDMYTETGEYIGPASSAGHWDRVPPSNQVFYGNANGLYGLLDHSQVFHRLPTQLRWNEDVSVKAFGDGDFFSRLVVHHGPIWPICEQPLTLEHLFK